LFKTFFQRRVTLVKIEKHLAELGIILPEAPRPLAAYVPAVSSGNLIFVSGQLCLVNGVLSHTGRLGREVTLEQGYAAARIAAINSLAIIKQELGSLDRVKRIVKVVGYVASEPDFSDQPKVVNGASELLAEVFGDQGRHARSAVGVNALPLNTPVEIEIIVEFD
jgi:enamine deaminase RidA (YjgF/YER057c/UK114 family)